MLASSTEFSSLIISSIISKKSRSRSASVISSGIVRDRTTRAVANESRYPRFRPDFDTRFKRRVVPDSLLLVQKAPQSLAHLQRNGDHAGVLDDDAAAAGLSRRLNAVNGPLTHRRQRREGKLMLHMRRMKGRNVVFDDFHLGDVQTDRRQVAERDFGVSCGRGGNGARRDPETRQQDCRRGYGTGRTVHHTKAVP